GDPRPSYISHLL
nr:Chain P, PHAGE DISPLAY DERIVED ANTIGEN [synthetic construct]4BH8_P Chain P, DODECAPEPTIDE ANTIGEN [synthetic construct]